MYHNKLALTQFVKFAEEPVMCSTERSDQRGNYITHCNVTHSINTVPTYSCPLQSTSASQVSVDSEMKQLHVSECAYDNVVYNETTFTINITDIVNKPKCIVRYSAVGNTSVSYAEEEFVVSQNVTSTLVTLDSGRKSTESKYELFIALI